MINETLARRNAENYSFSEYVAGSATREFETELAEVSKMVEIAKLKVSSEAKGRLDVLLFKYRKNYSDWVNARNESGSRHVSVMVSGAGNYNLKAHQKWMEREGKSWEKYDDLRNIEWDIGSIIRGDSIISSDDVDVLEKLNEKLEHALSEHAEYKEKNLKARKEGVMGVDGYVLSNSNGRIKSIRDRIKKLEKLKSDVTSEIVIGDVRILDNVEAQRLQIYFLGKPTSNVIDELKKRGFKWAPSTGAWQRFRGNIARCIAKEIVGKYCE